MNGSDLAAASDTSRPEPAELVGSGPESEQEQEQEQRELALGSLSSTAGAERIELVDRASS